MCSVVVLSLKKIGTSYILMPLNNKDSRTVILFNQTRK
jgi:hypothetical protein